MKVKNKVIAQLLVAFIFLVYVLVPAVDAYAATATYTTNGIKFTLPGHWKYSKANSTSEYRYYYLDTGDVVPMLMFASTSGVSASEFNKSLAGDILEGMASVLDDADYDRDDISSVKVAGYKGYILNISGTISGIYADMRMLIVHNPSKKKIVSVSIADQHGDDDYLDDIQVIAKKAKKAVSKKTKPKKSTPSVLSASKFESALNEGKDMTGKKVRFKVTDYAPNSAFGYNLMGGKHLNFVSAKNPHVRKGQTIIVKVTDVYSFLGSWIITYKKV